MPSTGSGKSISRQVYWYVLFQDHIGNPRIARR
jgi:hypothetical protein